MTENKYEFTEDMREISGFGGEYEQACRDMVIAGVKHIDKYPYVFDELKEMDKIFEISKHEDKRVRELYDVMMEVVGGDCTGAMFDAAVSHIAFIQSNSWDEYVKRMSEAVQVKEWLKNCVSMVGKERTMELLELISE